MTEPLRRPTDEPEDLPAWGGWGPETRDDPFPLFDAVREEAPVHRVRLSDGHEAWLVVSHEAARTALKDPRVSKDMLAALDQDPDVVADGLPGPAFSRHMLNVDPPVHTRLRRLVTEAFTPARVAALEPSVRAMADELLDTLADTAATGAPVDLVEGYARPLPFRVIGELLGIPETDRPGLHDAFLTLLAPWPGAEPPSEAVEASDTIVAYLEDLVAAKAERPGDDLVSELVAASTDGDRLTRQELLSTLFQLVVAGHDTTTSLIGNGVVALLDHPDQLAVLVARPELLPTAVSELVRYTAPVPHATFRMTTEPILLDGVDVPAHEQVLVCLGAANRDPAGAPDPQRLDVGRRPPPHLGFGHGIHYCLGASLARLEARVAFERLLARFPGLVLATDRTNLAWSRGDGLVLRGLAALPVHLRDRVGDEAATTGDG